MKPLGLVFAVLLAASTVLAQHGGGGHTGGSHSGGGHSGGAHTGGGGGFHNGGGGSVGGHGGYSGGRSYGYTGGVRYVAPVYSYGYYAPLSYGSSYVDPGYGYAAPAPVAEQGMQEPMPQQQMDFGPGGGQPEPPPADGDSLRIYQAPAPSPQEAAMSEGRYYLIAYKDHSVYTALAFWMENGVLNYVTPQNAHNQVSLDRLDVDLTKTLNSRRGMAFNIVN